MKMCEQCERNEQQQNSSLCASCQAELQAEALAMAMQEQHDHDQDVTMTTPLISIEELDSFISIDAQQYHTLVHNRIDGRSETYDEVKNEWPDFEGGAEPIAKAAGMVVLFQSNDNSDIFHSAQMREVYDRYCGQMHDNDQECTNEARVYQLFRDHPMVHTLVFTEMDTFGQEVRDNYYLAKPEDVDAIASSLSIALPLMNEEQTFNRDTLYEITEFWFDNYRCEIVEQLVKRELTVIPESVDESSDILNAAEAYAWNILRSQHHAFGLGREEEEQIAGLLAEWAQVGRYALEIPVAEKQASKELSKKAA